MKKPSLLPLLAFLAFCHVLHSGESLETLFANPPAGAHPHTWWHWCSGNVSKEGITLDLEAMHRIGVTGAQIFNVSLGGTPEGSVSFGSPEWSELNQHAIKEAARLGMELAFMNCAGWSESGGPWVTPEQSMQNVVWTETHIKGGGHFTGTVDQPKAYLGYYRDIALYAFPSSPDAEAAKTFADGGKNGPLSQVSLSNKTPATLTFSAAKDVRFVQVEYATPVKVNSVQVEMSLAKIPLKALPLKASVEASEDGKTFRSIAAYQISRPRFEGGCKDFPETTARFFRISAVWKIGQPGELSISSIDFFGGGIPNAECAAGFTRTPNVAFSGEGLPKEACIDRSKIIDLSAKMNAEGKLDWDVPAGNWTVLRMGHTSNGTGNHPAPEPGRGLECDKMSRAAVEAHFAAMMGKIIADAGPLAGKSLKMVLADSWEAGCQNWTPAMREEFIKRRGYDPLPWLPCIAGRVVGSLEESERFLWDFRRTIADLIAENHYGTFQELCHKHNMLFTAEAPGINIPCPADELQCKARTDIPMGEFWMNGNNDSREPACAAHIGGQQIASAEAFTARMEDSNYAKAPFDHKALGDANFCRGINRFVFHRYAMQPWKDRFPGMSMGPFGTNFERTNTWWEQAGPWMQYISRSQALLQAGLFQADVLYLYGEGAPVTLTKCEPKIPAGYDYDAIDAEALIENLTVTDDGYLTLPSGMRYRVLLLPPTDRLTPAMLRKIKELVTAGATVLGDRPSKSPSLTGYPKCDAEVAALAAELWGNTAETSGSRTFGKGRVVWGKPLAELLAEAGVKPDFESARPEAKCAWIHRRADDSDIYFVSNQSDASQIVPCTFRVAGKVPELWHADTGKIEAAPAFSEKDGRTTVPISFDPAGSVFVVFRKPSEKVDAVLSATRNGSDPFESQSGLSMPALELSRTADGALRAAVTQPGVYEVKTRLGKTLKATVAKLPEPQLIEGPWVLQFPPKWGAPAQVTLEKLMSWTDHSDEGVKHFSGTAAYVKEFDWKGAGAQTRYFLDLGTVKELAQVVLNGKDLGVLWKPPFRVDVTDALKPGKNSLEVRVTNLWPNRLIGDAALPEEKRLTWTSYKAYKADDPLLPSGLLGPVKIQAQALAELAVTTQ